MALFDSIRSQSAAANSPLLQHRGWWTLSLPLLGFLLLPLIALLARTSPADVWTNLFRPEVAQTALLSLKTSAISTVLTVIFGTPLAYLMARHRFPGKRTLDTLIDLPMVLPPAVAGVALLMAFGRTGVIGQLLADWGVTVVFTQTAVVMAQTFVAAPLFIRSATVGFASVDAHLEEAALIDGASPWQVFRHVTLPLTSGALLSGALLTWARALGEFGATIIFAGNLPGRTQTMPLAIYIGFELNLDVALTLSVLLIGASFGTLLLVRRLLL
jgi:molybdate transport system permease protein